MSHTEPGPKLSAPSIKVDLVALRRMGVALKSLAEEMSGRSGTLVGEVADPDLGDALRHAERDWWNQKRELHTYLDGASKAVHGAVTAYEQVEAGLSNAMHPTQGVSKHVG